MIDTEKDFCTEALQMDIPRQRSPGGQKKNPDWKTFPGRGQNSGHLIVSILCLVSSDLFLFDTFIGLWSPVDSLS